MGEAGSSLRELSKSEQKCWDKLWARPLLSRSAASQWRIRQGVCKDERRSQKERLRNSALAGRLAPPGGDVRRGDGPTRLLVTYTCLWLADDRDE